MDLFSTLAGAADAVGQATGILPQSTNQQPNNLTGTASNSAAGSVSQTGAAAPATAAPSNHFIWYALGGGLLLLGIVYVVIKK